MLLSSRRSVPESKKNIKLFYNRYRRTLDKYINQGRPLRLANNIKEIKEHYSKLFADFHTKYLTRLGNKLNNLLSGPKAYHTALKKHMG